MSSALEEKIYKSIEEFQSRLDQINDASRLSTEISVSILSQAKKIVEVASASDSIDERINLLVSGINSIVEYSRRKAESVTRKVEDLKLQIKTLEDQPSSLERELEVKEQEKKS